MHSHAQGNGIRGSGDQEDGSRALPEVAPGLHALQHSGEGWYTTAIMYQDGGQQAVLTLNDLLGPPGRFDPEHPHIVELLEHLHHGMAGGGRVIGNPALRRIAQAGPQDFTEVGF